MLTVNYRLDPLMIDETRDVRLCSGMAYERTASCSDEREHMVNQAGAVLKKRHEHQSSHLWAQRR